MPQRKVQSQAEGVIRKVARGGQVVVADPDWDLIIRDIKLKVVELKATIRQLDHFLEQCVQWRKMGVKFSEWPKYFRERRSWRRRVI